MSSDRGLWLELLSEMLETKLKPVVILGYSALISTSEKVNMCFRAPSLLSEM